MRSFRRRFVSLIPVATALALAVPVAAAQAEPPPWLKVEDGVTQPIFDFTKAIEESVYVESSVDSDGDGKRDRIHIMISRPAETRDQGIKVPVVFEHSPYRSPNGGPLVNHPVDFNQMPQEFIRPGGSQEANAARVQRRARAARAKGKPDLPGGLDNYYVPRGYAVVLGESVGTYRSDGCSTAGDDAETQGTKAVIDWLNGRTRGWNDDGAPVRADWTTGAVGMIGTSYNGTLPNQVATTGVEGLKTIVPVAAISSWYDYYRANGLVRAPHSRRQGVGDNSFQGEDTDVLAIADGGPERVESCAHVYQRLTEQQNRTTGDYSQFWRERDYLPRARNVQASVFAVHGLSDWNVMTKAFAEWWYRLSANGVPRKIWLHNGGHGGPGPAGSPSATLYQRTVNRWFDHWLFEVPNGIMDEPRATVQRVDGTNEQHADWPLPGTRNATLFPAADDRSEPGTLASRPQQGGPKPRQGFVDKGRELDTDDVLIQTPDDAHPNRLVYRSPALTRDVRMSGTPLVNLRTSVNNRYAANLTAVLVDYGPFLSAEAPVMVTRGWQDVQNRNNPGRSQPIQQGQEYGFRFDMQPDDYVFKAGHRIGLVVVSTDHDYTIRPLPGTELTVFPARSELTLPIVGGQQALGF